MAEAAAHLTVVRIEILYFPALAGVARVDLHPDFTVITSAREDARVGRMPSDRVDRATCMSFEGSDLHARLSPPDVSSRICAPLISTSSSE